MPWEIRVYNPENIKYLYILSKVIVVWTVLSDEYFKRMDTVNSKQQMKQNENKRFSFRKVTGFHR